MLAILFLGIMIFLNIPCISFLSFYMIYMFILTSLFLLPILNYKQSFEWEQGETVMEDDTGL